MSDYLDRLEQSERDTFRRAQRGPIGNVDPPEAFLDYPSCVVCGDEADIEGRWCVTHAPARYFRTETP